MPKRFRRSKATGKLGVAFVERVVFGAGSIFREVPEDVDLGIDGYIEFVDEEISTGLLVGVQVKAGASYLTQKSDAPYFSMTASKADFEYWDLHSIPVALIAYDPSSNSSGWLDLTGFIRGHPEALVNEKTTLTIHGRASAFNIEALRGDFREAFQSYHAEAGLFDFANLVATERTANKLYGFNALLNHRKSQFSELLCFMLLSHLFHQDEVVRETTTDILSRFLNHPETSFSPPDSIRDYIRSRLSSFSQPEVAELIRTAWIDKENFMQRGSIGQSVGVLIANIPKHADYLYEIATAPSRSNRLRWGALLIIGEFGVESAIEKIVVNFDQIDWQDTHEAASWILQVHSTLDD